MPASFLFVYVV